jgi:hypothetical protein
VTGNADKTTYTVIAKRWKRGWELHIEGIGVTQSRTLNDAEAMVRDYIHLDTGEAPDSFDVDIVPEVSQELDRQTREARRAVIAAEKAQQAAAARSREVARGLKGIGLTGREIAVVLRVSPQRVSQLLRHKDARAVEASAKHGERLARVSAKVNLGGKLHHDRTRG